jgi:hypothetical protein
MELAVCMFVMYDYMLYSGKSSTESAKITSRVSIHIELT